MTKDEVLCLRDLLNADKYMSEYIKTNTALKRGYTMVLSIDNSILIRKRFTTQNIVYDTLSNYISCFPKFVSNVNKNDTVLIFISGHGYQQKSVTTEETDRLDEYICHRTGKIIDNQINDLLLQKLPMAKRVICLADTCHSGTIFDNTNKYSNIFSISACLDNQLDSCDIGNNTGFGGALTVHLFDQPNACATLINGSVTDINKLVKVVANIIVPLRQVPLYIGPLNF